MTVFPKGSSKKEPVDYDDGRSEEEFVEFLNEKAGTNRLVGGALNDNAGRIVDLDELAKKLSAATNEAEKSSVFTEVEKVLAKVHSKWAPLKITNLQYRDAKYYAKVFEKVKADPQYPMNEKHRLEAIVAKGALASDKQVPSKKRLTRRVDNFKTRINILSAFAVSGKGLKHEEL